MAGIGRYRNLWEHRFKTCHGVVFVIDSSDRMRLGKEKKSTFKNFTEIAFDKNSQKSLTQ